MIKSIASIICIAFSFNVVNAQNKADSSIISVNQSGYNINWPKRFTAPLVKDGAVFNVVAKGSNKVLYKGNIKAGLGDFSAFRPTADNVDYQIKIDDGNKTILSFPFGIGKFWLQRNLLQAAVDFMIDNRSVTGTHASAFGGAPWRDGTFYSYEVPSLVLQYLSNPSVYDNMPVQINYKKDKQRVLSADFKYVMEAEGQTALQSTKEYYNKIDAPVGDNIPDVIQNIHWGIGYYLLNPVTQDPSGGDEGRRLHPQTLEQFAYFLYGYPQYQKYFTKKFYKQAKDFATEQWALTGLLGEFTTIGTAKGREAPGHSIMPNLMMYEVAKRDGDTDADKYFKAAFEQTNWIVKKLDWKDPQTTKGQRMSEHVLIPALVYFLQNYPEKAPKGLKKKIEDWATVAISKSDNMWDFRRYDLTKNWSVPDFSETGNIAGFSGIAFSAAMVIDNPKLKKRLVEIAVAAIDDLFGRNPQNACSAYHQDRGFSNLEKGWPKAYKDDVCARLELVRGTFSSISNTNMYPYQPSGKFGHLEGWTAFNSAWNKSLAYITYYDTSLRLFDKHFSKEKNTLSTGILYVQLEMPATHLKSKPEVLKATLVCDGVGKEVDLIETAPKTQIYRAIIKDNQLKKYKKISLNYGNQPFLKSITIAG